jgi:thioredoxin 1
VSSTLPQTTDATFQGDVLESDRPVLVKFTAEWCPPCRALEPVLESLASERHDLAIVTLDVDDNPQTPTRYGVLGFPTMILFRDGQEAARVVGAMPKQRLVAALGPALAAA